jgi:hypothetical protein
VREVFDFRLALAAHHVDRALDEIAHHALDVAPDVPDLGELRRLDLDERGAGELGEAARDLRFADAGGPMRMMLFGEISSRIASGARCRRHRLRSAMATAFFASLVQRCTRSSSRAIWRGVRSASLARLERCE